MSFLRSEATRGCEAEAAKASKRAAHTTVKSDSTSPQPKPQKEQEKKNSAKMTKTRPKCHPFIKSNFWQISFFGSDCKKESYK